MKKHLFEVIKYLLYAVINKKINKPLSAEPKGEIAKNYILLLFHFSVAVAAINGSVIAGLEGNLSFFATTSASCREEFSCGLSSVLLSGTASLASLGFVLETFFSIEFLFTCCEYEFSSAIFAYQCLVLIHVCLPRFDKIGYFSP